MNCRSRPCSSRTWLTRRERKSAKGRTLRRVEVYQRAQFHVGAQFLAQQFLIIAEDVTGARSLRAAATHACLRRCLDLFIRLVREVQRQLRERLRDGGLAGEEREAVLFVFDRGRQAQLAVADEDRAGHTPFDWRQKIDFAGAQREGGG